MPRIEQHRHCPHCKGTLAPPTPRLCPHCGGSLQVRYLKSGCLTSKPLLLFLALSLGGALARWLAA